MGFLEVSLHSSADTLLLEKELTPSVYKAMGYNSSILVQQFRADLVDRIEGPRFLDSVSMVLNRSRNLRGSEAPKNTNGFAKSVADAGDFVSVERCMLVHGRGECSLMFSCTVTLKEARHVPTEHLCYRYV